MIIDRYRSRCGRSILLGWALLGVWPGVVPALAGDSQNAIERASARLARELAGSLAGARIEVVAVLPFDDLDQRSIRLGQSLATGIRAALVEAAGPLRVVDRRRIDRVLEEQELDASGRFDSTSVAAVGQLLGADALIQGEVGVSGDLLLVSAEAVSVRTGVVLGTANATIPREAVDDELLERVPNAMTGQRFDGSDLAADAIEITVRWLVPWRDRRFAVLVVSIENRLDQDQWLAFAKGDFGACEVHLVGAGGARYGLVGASGSGGLACVARDAMRADHTLVAAREVFDLPLLFKAKKGTEIVGDVFRFEAHWVRFTPNGRASIEIEIPGITTSSR